MMMAQLFFALLMAVVFKMKLVDGQGFENPEVRHIKVSATSVNITFVQPTNTLQADEYRVIITRCPATSLCSIVGSLSKRTTSGYIEVEGLEEASTYSVSVTAVKSSFAHAVVENIIMFITLTAVPKSAPRDLTITEVTSVSISLSWRNIICIERNGEITEFMVQFGPINGTLTSRKTGTPLLNYIIEGLLPYTDYRIQIAGINMNGSGPFSEFAGPIRTSEDVPGRVSDVSVKPELFYVNISWSPPELPNGVITAYDICYLVNDSSTNRTVPPKPTYVSVDLSPPDTISGVVVIAHTRVGPGLASLLNAVSSLQVPPMVADVIVKVFSETALTVSWSRLDIQKLTNYIVFYSLRETSAVSDIIIEPQTVVLPSESSLAIKGLVANKEYQVQIQALATVNDEVVVGPRSSPVYITLTSTTTSSTELIIVAVAVFGSTVLLYSFVLSVVLCCYKKLADAGKDNHSIMPAGVDTGTASNVSYHSSKNIGMEMKDIVYDDIPS